MKRLAVIAAIVVALLLGGSDLIAWAARHIADDLPGMLFGSWMAWAFEGRRRATALDQSPRKTGHAW